MGLFYKKQPSYKETVEFLSLLSPDEFKKINKVVRLYRAAHREAKKVLGSPLDKYKLEYENIGEPRGSK